MTPEEKLALPYRKCVGVMLLNKDNKVWIGHRLQIKDDAEGKGKWWQMPQGGIDPGEDTVTAAFRELKEETGATSATLIEEAAGWFYYDLPEDMIGIAWKGRYRGQKQRWLALRFTGDDSEIDISGIGHAAEFDKWRWADMDELAGLIVDFKHDLYVKVVEAFRHLR